MSTLLERSSLGFSHHCPCVSEQLRGEWVFAGGATPTGGGQPAMFRTARGSQRAGRARRTRAPCRAERRWPLRRGRPCQPAKDLRSVGSLWRAWSRRGREESCPAAARVQETGKGFVAMGGIGPPRPRRVQLHQPIEVDGGEPGQGRRAGTGASRGWCTELRAGGGGKRFSGLGGGCGRGNRSVCASEAAGGCLFPEMSRSHVCSFA